MIQWWVPGFSFCFTYPRCELKKQAAGKYQGTQIRESPKWKQSSPCPLYYLSMPFLCPLHNLCMPSLTSHVFSMASVCPLYLLWPLYAFSMVSLCPLHALSMISLRLLHDLCIPSLCPFMPSLWSLMPSLCPLYLLWPLYTLSTTSLCPLLALSMPSLAKKTGTGPLGMAGYFR